MARRRWQQITFTIPPAYQELLIGQLALLPFEGFLQEEDRLICSVEKKRWTVQVERRLKYLLSRFQREFPDASVGFSAATVHEQNWNARWEKAVGIVEATERIIIKPSWKNLRKKDRGKIVLHVDPKMSFGTGHHETTRLCLVLLERHVRNDAMVLDMGCGTGILAIAAVKLGAARAIGIDHDSWSVKNARENVKRNRAEKKVAIRKGDHRSIPGRHFDLIVSNIDLKANLELLPRFLPRLGPGGMLILSGLLVRDTETLLDSLHRRNLVPVEIVTENEWAALGLTKLHEN